MRWRRRPPIGGQDNDGVSLLCSAPYTLLPLRGISPQGETRNLRRKTESHILHVPLRHSPFGGWRHHLARWEACHWIRGSQSSPMNPVPLPPPQAVALWVLSTGAMSLQESIERFILPPEQGEVRRSRKGGGERSEPIRRMPIMPYDTERRIRNADFISIAAERQSTTLGPKGRQTYEPSGP